MKRSAIAFARDARTGVRMIRISAPVKTASKAAANLLSRSRIRNRNRSARSSRSMSRLRACWVTQAAVGWAVIPAMCALGDVPPQHGDLVRQHQDLDVLGAVGAGERRQPAQHSGEHQVHESEGHSSVMMQLRLWPVTMRPVGREVAD